MDFCRSNKTDCLIKKGCLLTPKINDWEIKTVSDITLPIYQKEDHVIVLDNKHVIATISGQKGKTLISVENAVVCLDDENKTIHISPKKQ